MSERIKVGSSFFREMEVRMLMHLMITGNHHPSAYRVRICGSTADSQRESHRKG